MLNEVKTGSAADSGKKGVGLEKPEEPSAKPRKSGWFWPLGVAATGVVIGTWERPRTALSSLP